MFQRDPQALRKKGSGSIVVPVARSSVQDDGDCAVALGLLQTVNSTLTIRTVNTTIQRRKVKKGKRSGNVGFRVDLGLEPAIDGHELVDSLEDVRSKFARGLQRLQVFGELRHL